MSDYEATLRDITARGPRPKSEVVSDLVAETRITEEAAEQMVNHLCLVKTNGEGPIVLGIDEQITELNNIDHEVGEPTGETFHGLPILEDTGHPMVPELGHTYMPREMPGNRTDVEVVARALANVRYSTLLIGETGVGKNALLKYIAQETNRPQPRINFGLDTTYEKLVGLYTPTDDGNGGVTFEWRDGILTAAVRNGWMFVADEINAAPPEASVPLNGVNESYNSRELVIEVKNEVLTHGNGGIDDRFLSVGTMNPPRYAGTQPMNMAFKGRFFPIRIPYLDEEAEIALLLEMSDLSEYPNGDVVAGSLVDLAGKLRSQMVDVDSPGNITVPVSTRQLDQIASFIANEDGTEFMPPKDAIEMVLKGFSENQSDWKAISATMQRVFGSGSP